MKSLHFFLIISFLLTACASSQGTVTSESSPVTQAIGPTSTEVFPTFTPESAVPTEAPRPAMLDATQHYGEWDLSAFTAEQQAWIQQAMEDPWHAPMEAKNFYDQMRIEGIKEQTSNQSITLEKYAEWLFKNGVHETAPLPFAWLKANLGDPKSYPLINENGKPGYIVEGYDASKVLEGDMVRFSATTGFGENTTGYTQELLDLMLKGRRETGGNVERDTFYGESFFIVFPRSVVGRGDLMALVDIAGTAPAAAQFAVLRSYDTSGTPQYAIMRLQYQDHIVGENETSCMKIPLAKSSVCAPGTKIPGAILSAWDDLPRNTQIPASREKLLELMNLPTLTNPVRLTFQATTYKDEGTLHSNIFIDGANIVHDIKIPTVDSAFYTK